MIDVSGCRAKIERAKKHIYDFDRERISFLDTKPYVVLSEFNAEEDTTEYFVGRLPAIPPCLPVVVGDAAHNLREALDYLACELARSVHNSTENVCFPICESSEKYRAESEEKTKGVPRAAKDVIDLIQPYRGGHGHFLWLLHAMNAADKQRLLMTIGTNIDRSLTKYFSPTGDTYTSLVTSPVLNEGDLLGSVIRDHEGDQTIAFTFDVGFGEPEVLAGEAVLPLLTNLVQMTEAIVSHFESAF